WRQGKRMPGLPALVKLAELFEIAGDRLVTATFPELLEREVGDVDRFVRVERKLAPTMLPVGTRPRKGTRSSSASRGLCRRRRSQRTSRKGAARGRARARDEEQAVKCPRQESNLRTRF